MKKIIFILSMITFGLIATDFSLANANSPVGFLKEIAEINHAASATKADDEFKDHIVYNNAASNSFSLTDNTAAASEKAEVKTIPDSVTHKESN